MKLSTNLNITEALVSAHKHPSVAFTIDHSSYIANYMNKRVVLFACRHGLRLAARNSATTTTSKTDGDVIVNKQ